MNKKNILLIVSVIVLGSLAFLAINLIRNSGKSDTELLEFSVADTASVSKIIIKDPNGTSFTLLRGEDRKWTDEQGSCVTQMSVSTILETFKNIEFKGYVPENSRKTITNRMAATHTKVEIFQGEKWIKTWYIGFSTQDHYGTYMLLETPSEKSDLPVIMKIKGFNGIIEPRFYADARRWKCTEVFALERNEIQGVYVDFTENNERDFTVENSNNVFTVKQNGITLEALDTAMVFRYLNNYKKIHYEFANFDLEQKQVDSLKKAKPFCKLTVKKQDGTSQTIKMHRIKGNGEKLVDDFGDSVSFDPNRFWSVLPNGEVVKCQYYVFNPLIMGHMYFAQRPKEQ